MVAGGLPTVQVLLDDGTGTFPYDITAYVRMPEGITITRGRADELASVQPSTCTLTLDNADGRFTYLSTVIASPTPIKVNQRIKVKLTVSGTTVDRFTGYVQEWPVSWPTGGDEMALVPITASDALARLSRVPAHAPLADVMIADGATMVWPLTDPAPTITPGMVGAAAWPVGPSAASVGPLRMLGQTTAYPDTYPSFAADAMPNGNGSVFSIPNYISSGPDPSAGPYYLGTAAGGSTTSTGTGPGVASTSSFSLECAFRITGNGHDTQLVELADSIRLNTAIILNFDVASQTLKCTWAYGTYTVGTDLAYFYSTANVGDGAWHFATVVISNGGKTVTLLLDGAQAGTATNTNAPTQTLNEIHSGRYGGVASVGYIGFTPSALTLAQHRIHNEVAHGTTGIRSDLVVQRYATIANVPFTAIENGSQLVPAFTASDVATVMSTVMDAENGRLFVDGSGTLTFQARTHALPNVYTNTPDITVTVDLLEPDAAFAVDTQKLLNRADVTRNGGSTTTNQDASSITQHGVFGVSKTVEVMDDAQASNLGAYLVAVYAQPGARLGGATIDLLTQTTTIQVSFLTELIGRWLQITGLPAQSPAGTTANLYVEGTTERIWAGPSGAGWTLGLNTAPKTATATTWWRLGDANFQLGTNTRLFY